MVRFFRAEDQLTPVHVAVIWGKAKILHLLLCNGGDPTRRDEVGGCVSQGLAHTVTVWSVTVL